MNLSNDNLSFFILANQKRQSLYLFHGTRKSRWFSSLDTGLSLVNSHNARCFVLPFSVEYITYSVITQAHGRLISHRDSTRSVHP